MGTSVVMLVMLVLLAACTGSTVGHAQSKRSAAGNGPGSFDYPDYPSKYDEYPVVVPKRAALLLDRLMVALQKAVDDQGLGGGGESRALSRSVPHHPVSSSQIVPSADEQTMDLQRRGQAKGRVYWRCYFNAVTCFKRK